jgi:glycosyltransferase involved in cell wall biosynthesis
MGGQKGVVLFYKYLQNHCNIIIAASRDNEKYNMASVYNFLFPNKLILFNIFLIGKLKRLIKERNIDVIIIEHSYPAFIGYICKKLLKIPFIIHGHNLEADRFKLMKRWWWKLFAFYEGWAFRNTDFNFFISKDDKVKAIDTYKTKEEKSTVITYGIEKNVVNTLNNIPLLKKIAGFSEDEKIFFFNGTLEYRPNYEALYFIINKIMPLIKDKIAAYAFLITGSEPPAAIIKMLEMNKHIRNLGFVEDLQPYYQMADLFINPILNNSGIKTKVIEAVANGCTIISTLSGAAGINKDVCGNKLIVVADNDWKAFADQMIKHIHMEHTEVPNQFFEYYSWENITKKAAGAINSVINKYD